MVTLGHARAVTNLSVISALAILLGACSSFSLGNSSPTASPEPGVEAEMPATIRSEELVGKWSGTEVKLDGEELLIMKESDIMGVSA